jgi:SAM-dependent methyltransferase
VDRNLLVEILKRRTNITAIVLGDMTRPVFADESFDGVVAVEVIEHVPDGMGLVAQMYRVLRPDGWLVLTTPNGESVPLTNPDHLRHYRRVELEAILAQFFADVEVGYAVKDDCLRRVARKGWARPRGFIGLLGVPLVMACSLLANARDVLFRPPAERSDHLFAVARKRQGGKDDA